MPETLISLTAPKLASAHFAGLTRMLERGLTIPTIPNSTPRSRDLTLLTQTGSPVSPGRPNTNPSADRLPTPSPPPTRTHPSPFAVA